ncbi:MAG: ParB N-terminal domain-containing protein [Treponema sp.]|nr:ParB N-terminal domain-containing protein [Treponema sp.]
MQVLIKDIKVKKRIRKEMGDIGALADSLKRYGLINPIVISKGNQLIAGQRRLEAAKLLGWRTINAVVSETKGDLTHLEMELEENIQRHDFNMEEIAAATRAIYRLRNPGFFRRIINAIVYFFKRLFGMEVDL